MRPVWEFHGSFTSLQLWHSSQLCVGRNHKQNQALGLVILKLWMKSVALKPFTSRPHHSWALSSSCWSAKSHNWIYTLLLVARLRPYICFSVHLLQVRTLTSVALMSMFTSVHSVLRVTSCSSSTTVGHIRAVTSSRWSRVLGDSANGCIWKIRSWKKFELSTKCERSLSVAESFQWTNRRQE